MTPLPTLVVGYGNMGSKHVRVLGELGGAGAVWGIVDPSEGRRASAASDASGARTFADLPAALDAMTDDSRPACATVAAPTTQHAELARILLEAGIPTMLEKPIASTHAEGRELLELSEAKNTLLVVGHIERFNPAVVAARKLVADGVIGKVIQLSLRRVGGTPADAVSHEDVLVDLAVHDFDLAYFITGSRLEIVDALGHRDEGLLDSALVLGRLEDGASLQLQVNWRTPVKIRQIELTGTTGYAEVNLITQQIILFRQNPLLASTDGSEDPNPYFSRYLMSFASPDRVELGIERREPLREELAAFWRAVAGGEPSPVPAADAVVALELTELARKLASGR